MIPQMIPYFDELETKVIMEYMHTGGFLTEFIKTRQFESTIQEFTKSRHAIVVNNGTVSLIMMLMALGVGPGDEVIVPNYTMIATANSVIAVGANPVFVDVEPQTLCIELEGLRSKITKNTKAIYFVSANGRYPTYGIENLEDLCKSYDLFLLEDAAQSLGSYFPDGRHIGTRGIMGSLSFSVPKIITTGQGGCILTNDDLLAERLRRLKDFGRSEGGNDIHDSIGYNFKFTDLQACIGIAQMSKLQWRIHRKKEIWGTYWKNLKTLSTFQLFNHNVEFTAPWFIDAIAQDRENLETYLKGKGIATRRMYPPINAQKAYRRPGQFPVSENIGKSGIWLPSYVQISESEISEVCEKIHEFYKK